MNNRMNIPSGGAGLVLLAVALTPVVLKKCKPAIKVVGESLERFGQTVQKAAAKV
jgi:hypothetical protein